MHSQRTKAKLLVDKSSKIAHHLEVLNHQHLVVKARLSEIKMLLPTKNQTAKAISKIENKTSLLLSVIWLLDSSRSNRIRYSKAENNRAHLGQVEEALDRMQVVRVQDLAVHLLFPVRVSSHLLEETLQVMHLARPTKNRSNLLVLVRSHLQQTKVCKLVRMTTHFLQISNPKAQ